MARADLLPRHPIYIPSKGRADRLQTAAMFDRDGVDYRVVVQPDQVAAYEAAGYGPRLLVLPEDGRGLVYARNWITAYSRGRGEERHWQIDDDIKEMWRVYRGFRLRCESGPAHRAMEDFVDRYENVALASPNSQFFVPVSKGGVTTGDFPPFYLNHRCYTSILFLNRVPFDWRPPNNEDADMTLQVLAGGWCTVLFNAFTIMTATTMTATGGQTEAFLAGARLAMVRALEQKWPGVVTVKRRFGHPQHFIKHDWRHFDNKLVLKQGVDLSSMAPNEYGLRLRALKDVESPRLRALLDDQEG